MSRVTAVAIDVHPAGATAPALAYPGSTWTWGSWTEVIASAGADLHIAGLVFGDATATSNIQFEVQIGTGAAAAEVGGHTWRGYLPGAASETKGFMGLFPVPVGPFTAGTRLSVRLRTSTVSFGIEIGLATYSSLSDTDHLTSKVMTTAPAGAAAVSITPSGTSWDWSSWVELSAGVSVETALLGIMARAPIASVALEYEIGTGASTAEVGFTSFRTAMGSGTGNGAIRNYYLPAAHPIAPNARVSVRMRKNGTDTTIHSVAMLYLHDTVLLVLPPLEVDEAETITVTDVVTATLINMLAVSKAETITVTDVVTPVMSNDLYRTVTETITLAESVSLSVNVLLVTVTEALSVDDDASAPIGTALSDRVFVRDYAFLAPNNLVVSAFEALTVTDGQLYSTSGGVPGAVGPEPSPPSGTTGLTDYWQTGI